MRKFTHIFFDLDHTLWDYDHNAQLVLHNLYKAFGLSDIINHDGAAFVAAFHKTNSQLWAEYNTGAITRDDIRTSRFQKVFEALGNTSAVDEQAMNDYFLHHCPRQSKVMDQADVVLDYLQKKYHLSIITNGFDDVQYIKLKACGLDQYFQNVFTSETTGHKKPAREIFDHALQTVNAPRATSLMIGDNPKTDILGAQNAGITPLLFNPHGTVRSTCELEIQQLSELMRIL